MAHGVVHYMIIDFFFGGQWVSLDISTELR